eukprot:UN00548
MQIKSFGSVTIQFTAEQDQANTPITVQNFMDYVGKNWYDGLVYHRVIPGFMVQGGGYNADYVEKNKH